MGFKNRLILAKTYFEQLDPPALRESRAFLWLWALSFYLNYAESWNYPTLTFAILGICIGSLCLKNLKWAWGLYLAFSTSLLLYKFPVLANHSIFNLFVNLYLIFHFLKGRAVQIEKPLAKSLLLGLVVVYLWAALHKINADYLFFNESCAISFMERINRTYFAGGLPSTFTQHGLVPISTIALELLIAIFLIRRKTFYLGLIFAASFHMVLAALEFIDFSMNSLSILFLSIGMFSRSAKNEFKKIIDLIPFYVVAQLLSGLVSFFEHERGRGTVGYHLQTFFFISFSIWTVFYGVKLSYKARSDNNKLPSLTVYAFPILLFIFGSFNYIGLSTAGTFSMFSNLRTEGATWNHLFIPKSLRFFSYQDKVYWINDIDPNAPRVNREHPRVNHGMPEIEFYRAWRDWQKLEQEPSYIDYELAGVTRRVGNIKESDFFEGRTYSWLERKLLFFRRIQREGKPNKCRW